MTDQRISADLAIVARTSRARPRSVETTLRQIASRATADTRDRDASASLAIGPIYAARIARIVAGSIVLLSIVALCFTLALVRVSQEDYDLGIGVVTNVLERTPRQLQLALGCIAVFSYAVAWRLALRRSERLDRARVDRLDRTATVISVAAPVCFVLFFTLVHVMIGTEQSVVRMVVAFDESWYGALTTTWHPTIRDWATWAYPSLVVGSIVGGLFVMLATRMRSTTFIVIVAIWLGLVFIPYGSTPSPLHDLSGYYELPNLSAVYRSLAMRGCIVLLFVASAALLLRHREIRALDGE